MPLFPASITANAPLYSPGFGYPSIRARPSDRRSQRRTTRTRSQFRPIGNTSRPTRKRPNALIRRCIQTGPTRTGLGSIASQPPLRSLRAQSISSGSSPLSQSRPSSSFLQVSRNSFSRLVHIAQNVLSLWVPLLRPELHLVVKTGEQISSKR